MKEGERASITLKFQDTEAVRGSAKLCRRYGGKIERHCDDWCLPKSLLHTIRRMCCEAEPHTGKVKIKVM